MSGIQNPTPSPVLHERCQGRLTLTTGVPVTTADVVGAATIYFTPYKGNQIALYDGAAWVTLAFIETSLALGTLTNDLPYDVFGYDNAGTLALELLAWTSKTARATALVLQDGVLCKTGALTRRYLGTFHTTATTTTEDSYAKRLLWNYYHRVVRPMRQIESADSWSYNGAAFRQANANTANQLAVVVGVAEVAIAVTVCAQYRQTDVIELGIVGIGEDSTSAFMSGCLVTAQTAKLANANTPVMAAVQTAAPLGYHFYAWLERGSTAGTQTWHGDAGAPTVYQTGMIGSIEG